MTSIPKTRRKCIKYCATLLLMQLFLAPSVFAYVGPGAGLSLIGALIGLVLAIIAALSFLIAWPIRRIKKRIKEQRNEEKEESVNYNDDNR